MVKALARVFRWQKLLEDGVNANLLEIERVDRIGPSFVSRIYRLVLLEPAIVEAILEGKQPAYRTLKDLMGPFPIEWAKQRTYLCPV